MRERQGRLDLKLRGKRYKHDPRALTWSKPPHSQPRPNYTERAAASFERGRHWITGLSLGPEECGTCHHEREARRGNKRGLHKCALRDTRSARSDIRLSWPSCELWRPKTKDDA